MAVDSRYLEIRGITFLREDILGIYPSNLEDRPPGIIVQVKRRPSDVDGYLLVYDSKAQRDGFMKLAIKEWKRL